MKKIYYAIAALIVFISACKKETSFNDEQSKDNPGKVITYHLKNGGQVTVQINDRGEYVVGGDVILSKDQIAYLEYNKVGDGKTSTPRSTFTNDLNKLWPGGVIYYTISDQSKANLIAQAINHWETYTPIRFIQRTNQYNYVDFNGSPSQGAGSSSIGMVGGHQYIQLASDAVLSNVIHEIGHTVGLMHEHTRADRDNYINISNVNNSWKDQYAIYSPGTGGQLGPLDYESIMIYGSYNASASNGSSAPQLTRKDGTTWNRMSVLSAGDIAGVSALYKVIYVRVSSEPGDVYQMDDWNEQYDTNWKIRFYADASWTTPIALPRNLGIAVTYQSTNYPYSEHSVTNNMYYDFVAEQGATEMNLWSMQTRISYNGSMGIQGGSYYQSLSTVNIINGFGIIGYQ